MGIPARFASEYPGRCLQLIDALEDYARSERLLGSFSVLAASAVLTIPFERASAKHFMFRDKDDRLSAAMSGLSKLKFAAAPFWDKEGPGEWRHVHIVEGANDSNAWVGVNGIHPFDAKAQDTIHKKSASEVLRAIRNALAHGNVIYLDADGREREGAELHYLAFLSRYEEGAEAQANAETYRLIATTEDDFLRFIKLWAKWIGALARKDRIVEAI
jgi:hypothetical protein